jgi:hypothetical protein
VKRKLSEIFYFFLAAVIKLRLIFYKLKNSNKPSIFIFTDSRGFDVTKITHKYNPFSWYTKYFIKNYKTDVYVCPERTTTVYDFLEYYHNTKKQYKFVLAHIGVVDFASRPISQNIEILESKKSKIIGFFGEEIYQRLINFKGYSEEYNGEKTSSTVPEFMVELIATEFNKIENLIWISCNDVDLNWVGNYKKRPSNSGMILEKSKMMLAFLKNSTILDLTKLSYSEIHEYTCDNVHLTKKGSRFILDNLNELIEKKYN